MSDSSIYTETAKSQSRALLSLILAVYASVVATVTVIVQLMNFFLDRSKITLSIQRQTVPIEEGIPGAGCEIRTLVIVENTGRRPVTIVEVGARRLFPKRGFAALPCDRKMPAALTEKQHLSALVDEEEVDLAEVEAWEARDAVGRCLGRLYVAPRLTRLRSHLRSYWAKISKTKVGH